MEKEHRESPKLNIENVQEKDLPAVTAIAAKLKLDVANPDPKIVGKGFLIYTLPEEAYRKRANPYFTVAKEGERVLGYLMCYERAFFEELIRNGDIGHEDGITRFIQDLEPSDQYIFADQIGLDYENRRKGMGSNLMRQLLERLKHEGITKMYGAILHQPVKNEASITFCSKLGARVVGEVTNQDGLVWGIYRFPIEEDK